MIKEIKNLPNNVIGFLFMGQITALDYERIIFPALKKNARTKKRIRMICKFNSSFKRFNLKAMIDDASIGMKYFREWERIAIVSDHGWLNHTIKAVKFLVPGHIKVFASEEFDNATKWVAERD